MLLRGAGKNGKLIISGKKVPPAKPGRSSPSQSSALMRPALHPKLVSPGRPNRRTLVDSALGRPLASSLTRPGYTDRRPGHGRATPRFAGSIVLPDFRDTLFNHLFERSNTSRSCYRPGAKMGSHPAKSRQESGGVWTVICPGKQHFANLLDSSRPARGLLHTEEVTGSMTLHRQERAYDFVRPVSRQARSQKS